MKAPQRAVLPCHPCFISCSVTFRGPHEGTSLIVASHLKMLVDNSQRGPGINEASMTCFQKLSSNYRERKNRNIPRYPGTCDWALKSQGFQEWKEFASGSLVLFADPGCGKSAFAKSLTDDQKLVTSKSTATVCYFFFKDDDEVNRSAITALSSLLHQILSQNPKLSVHIERAHSLYGDRILNLFSVMSDLLSDLMTKAELRDIIFILDAVDECDSRSRADILRLLASFGKKLPKQASRYNTSIRRHKKTHS